VFVPGKPARLATGRACRVVQADRRLARGPRIVRSCCLVRVAQLLPVAAWAVVRAAWFAVICCLVTAARAVICCLVNCSCCSYLLPGPGCLVAAERCLVRGPRAWCRWLPADLVAQLLPGAWTWCRWLPGRVCVCVPGRPVFVIRCPGSQTLGPRALVRDPWAACLAAWSVATVSCALARK
jgi:hypothetical protein